jgi:C_GCAxxG_C_C family probable redox protein
VLLAMAEQQGIRSDVIPQIATGFCSGFSRTAGTCGAVNGAVMGIGLALGRREPSQSVEACYRAVRLFLEHFEMNFGSLNCAELTGCHLGTPEGQVRFKQEGKAKSCYRIASEAARLAGRAIEEIRRIQNGNA